jgi:long-chain acyl-CoA synthetase
MLSIKKRFEELHSALTSDGKLLQANTILQRAAQRYPDRIALICEEKQITFKQLYQAACLVSEQLVQKNVLPGDRVLVIYENSIEFFIAYYGAWQTGAIVAPLNVYLHERELEHIINDAQPKVIIASPPQQKKLASLNNIPMVLGEEIFTATNQKGNPESTWNIPKGDRTTCTVLLYTSGTTGLPKGVMLSSNNIITNAIQGISNFDLTQNERILGALPLFHSYMQNTAIWSPCIAGATVILVPAITRSALLKALKHNPTAVLGIPQLFGLFCLMKTAPFKNVKLFVAGGDALHNKIQMGFELIYQRKIANGYGLTETSPFVSVDLNPARKPTGCVGKPMIGIQTEIRDEHNNALPICKKGLLWVKGDNIMLGYYNAPEATAKVLQNGWFNTGDLAYIDQDGYIILCGREKDLIIHKGFNIYPPEIENILTTHPAVYMAAVIGYQYDGDEVPVAFVATKETSFDDVPEKLITELKALCANNLARYKIPLHFYIKKELPTTATGKIDKKILRQELQDQLKKKGAQ